MPINSIAHRATALSAALLGVCGWCASSAQAEETFGFLDLRLGLNTVPTQDFRGGPDANRYSGEFNDAYRLSLMVIGPLCSLVPVGCGYQPRGHQARPSSRRSAHEYDDLIELEGLQWHEPTRGGFDLLVGLELSYITMQHEGRASATQRGRPEVDIDTFALTGHVGWGLAANPTRTGTLHFELTGFAGVGYSMISWRDVSGGVLREDETTGMYYEIGGRLAMFYTFNPGLQIGVNATLMHADHSMEVFGNATRARVEGPSLGAQLGWRF